MAAGPKGIIDRAIDLLDDYGPQIPEALPDGGQNSVGVVTQQLVTAAADLRDPPAPRQGVTAPVIQEYDVDQAAWAALASVLEVPSPAPVGGVTFGTHLEIPTPIEVDLPTPPSEIPTIPVDDSYLDAGLGTELEVPQVGTRPVPTPINGEPYDATAPALPPSDIPATPGLSDFVPANIEPPAIVPPAALDGGRPYTEDEQRTMHDAAINSTKRKERRAVNDAVAEGAARNFFAPTPLMHAKVLDVVDQALLEREAPNAAVTKEAYAADLKTNAELIGAASQLNKAYIQWYVENVKNLVGIQKFNLGMLDELAKSALELFNAKVALVRDYYGAGKQYIRAVGEQNDAVGASSAVGDAQLRSLAAEINAFSAQINTRNTVAGIADTAAQLDSLPWEALQNDVPLLDANIQVARSNLQGLDAAIGAYRRYYEADTDRFAAVADANQALSSIAQVDSANNRIHSKQIRAETARGDAYVAFKQGQLRELEAKVREYREYLQGHRSAIASLQQQVAAEAGKVSDYARAVGSKAQYHTDWNRASASKSNAVNALAAAASETSARSQALQAQAAAAEAKIEAGRLGAKAVTAGSFATAALGITSGTARIDGGVSVTDNTADNYNQRFVDSGLRRWERRESVEMGGS